MLKYNLFEWEINVQCGWFEKLVKFQNLVECTKQQIYTFELGFEYRFVNWTSYQLIWFI